MVVKVNLPNGHFFDGRPQDIPSGLSGIQGGLTSSLLQRGLTSALLQSALSNPPTSSPAAPSAPAAPANPPADQAPKRRWETASCH